jgi:hypothetical protein
MESNLRGIHLPSPQFRIAPLSKELSQVKGFNSLQTFFPAMSKLYQLTPQQMDSVWLDTRWRITALDISGTSGPCSLSLVPNQDISGAVEPRTLPAFLKVTHLLDPVRWMKGKYSLPKHNGLPWLNRTWASAWTKLQDSWNQAYVETIAAYALGRIRDEGVSPHFNEFYGAFCARAEIYRYNLTEDFGSFRNSRWFWNGRNNNYFKIHVMNTADPSAPISSDVLDDFQKEPPPSELYSDSEEDDDEEDEEVVITEAVGNVELESLHSDGMSELSFTKDSEKESEEDESEGKLKVYAELADFPVMLIAVEKNSGTMDALFDNHEEVGARSGTPEWELRWSAWIFQVVAAMSVAQTFIGLTHNDLHTNNIVWTSTTDEFLYYTLNSGATFKVPTFGKLFRIIDFGRAIFSINGTQFISDDFREKNDADGQYSFKPLHPRPNKEVLPNPSFDLSRLAVSLFEALFPDRPDDKEGGIILSSEEGLIMRETVSPLCNCIWSWMIDDEGRNILIEGGGEERFPGFDLYIHIAEHVHGAVPSKQFSKPAFDRFQVNPSEVANVKKWPLFC